MKCPKCEIEMEKAAKSDTLICRECGHTETSMTKAELVAKVEDQEKRLKALEEKKTEDKKEEPWI